MRAFHFMACVCVVFGATAADEKPRQGGRMRPEDAPIDDPRFIFKTDVPAHPLDVVLGRPGTASVTLSVLSYEEVEGMIAYGAKAGALASKTPPFPLKAGEPREVLLEGLQPNARTFYQILTRKPGAEWEPQPEGSVHTQRPRGSAFAFTLQADPHLDYNTDPALYSRCLANALADLPDFHVDLGDTFMCDKHRTRKSAASQYVAQRYYFGQIAHSAPLFLVLGNHDGESGRWLDGTADNLAVWSNAQRKKYFPNPMPGGIYTGNETADPQAGVLQNYYAWEWGDALFIVLDPFWYSKRQRGGDDNWGSTLGREQYDWLDRNLRQSTAKFRFVFIHHLVGGIGKDARGGAEAAGLYEWGGRDAAGTDLFQSKRPGWEMPIHSLLAKHRVSVVFHGHDHLYVKQDLDGVVYQEVPQPGHPRHDNTRSSAEYGYKSGTIHGSSGHLRVSVSPERATVEYVRSVLPEGETADRKNRAVTHRYEVTPR